MEVVGRCHFIVWCKDYTPVFKSSLPFTFQQLLEFVQGVVKVVTKGIHSCGWSQMEWEVGGLSEYIWKQPALRLLAP